MFINILATFAECTTADNSRHFKVKSLTVTTTEIIELCQNTFHVDIVHSDVSIA